MQTEIIEYEGVPAVMLPDEITGPLGLMLGDKFDLCVEGGCIILEPVRERVERSASS